MNNCYNFCVILDKSYIYKGLALYNSIAYYCPDFKLWILCMDDIAIEILKKMNLANVELVHLKNIEDADLLSVKKNRTVAEYAWTCKAPFILHLFDNFPNLSHLVYLDGDTFFFSAPDLLFQEFSDYSIMLTPHYFPAGQEYKEKTKGKYNAGAIFFKNDINSLNCLKWWRDRCIEWCYHYYEGGKMSDQMYLDQWKNLFAGVRDTENKGVNVSIWNIFQYDLEQKNHQILVDGNPLILYHFHSFQIYSPLKFKYSDCELPSNVINLIYKPYVEELKNIIKEIKRIDNSFNFGFACQPSLFKRAYDLTRKIYQLIFK